MAEKPVYEPPVSQTVSNEYPHYLAVMENGISRAISVWAVRERPNPSGDGVDRSRVECEADTGDCWEVSRERLCNTQAGAIKRLVDSISLENQERFATRLEHGNRDLLQSMAEMTSQYVEAAIDAAWCQLKIERMAEEASDTKRDKVLEICRGYVERRLSVFGEAVAEAVQRRVIAHVDVLGSAYSQRLANVEGQVALLSQLLTPAKPAATKTRKPPKKKR